MTALPEQFKPALSELLLSIADDKLVLGHRNSDWTGLAPILEEDIAFSSLAQDEIGHASAIYQFIAPWRGISADKLAFGRTPEEYRCAAIVVRADNFDWALALARQFFCDHCDILRLTRLSKSGFAPLAALGARLAAEERVHIEHSDAWLVRLGQGGDDSRHRMQQALDQLGVPAALLLEPPQGVAELERAGIYPPTGDMFAQWKRACERIATQAGLRLQLNPPPANVAGGRQGRHEAGFQEMWQELTEVYRLEPDAAW